MKRYAALGFLLWLAGVVVLMAVALIPWAVAVLWGGV